MHPYGPYTHRPSWNFLKNTRDLLIESPIFLFFYSISHNSQSVSWFSLNLYFLLLNWSLNLLTIMLTKQLFAFSFGKNVFLKSKFRYLLKTPYSSLDMNKSSSSRLTSLTAWSNFDTDLIIIQLT